MRRTAESIAQATLVTSCGGVPTEVPKTSVILERRRRKGTLYRNQQLRAVIDEHRLRHHDARTLTGLTAEIAHLRTAVEAIADLARRQDERIRRLERRNRQAG
jgi:hypothetical protein